MTLKVAAVFSNSMVLQRDVPLPIWGWADAGETIRVECAGQCVEATADARGAWSATLPCMSAGGPHELTAHGAHETISFSDVLVGDVWLCSGQSNMEWTVQASNKPEEEVPAANYPRMRLLTVPKLAVTEPLPDIDACWQACTPETVAQFSAVGYFFGRALHRQLDVPIGLINASWGGTVAEAWTSREALLAQEELAPLELDYERNVLSQHAKLYARYQQALRDWEEHDMPKDAGNSGGAQGWAALETDTSGWPEMEIPQLWQQAGLNFNGVVWFRKEVTLDAHWVDGDCTVGIGACDKGDISYVNGERVGGVSMADRPDSWCLQREYSLPAGLLRPGKNVIAVRVFSDLFGAGMTGPKNALFVKNGAGETIPLAGCWRYQVEQQFSPTPPAPAMPQGPGNPNSPYALFCGMIAPLIPFALCGAIWYQGESNADRAQQYRTLFPTMINDWRARWGGKAFSFYFVQLANFNAGSDTPERSPWAELREAQLLTLSLPHTGMAVTIDIGEGNDIHPRNKQDVGYRLALNALAQHYGHKVVYSGPMLRSVEHEGTAMRLQFDFADNGLTTPGGEAVAGFTIAGVDGCYADAQACIDGDSVLVSSPYVVQPCNVRYGWAANPCCNLYNAEGLPASPFRTQR